MPDVFKASATSLGVFKGGRSGASVGPLSVMQDSRFPTTRSSCSYNGRTRSKRNSAPCLRTVLMTSRLRHRSPTKPNDGPCAGVDLVVLIFVPRSDTGGPRYD